MGASAKKRLEAEAKWRKHMQQHEASGLSANEYCRRKGLEARYFSVWRRKLRERTQQKSKEQIATEAFIQVTPPEREMMMTIRTPGGYSLEVPAKTDERLLKNVLVMVTELG